MRFPDSPEYRIRIGRALVMMAVGGAFFMLGGTVLAQRDLPPAEGGMTYELGMPPVYKGRSGFEMGWYRPQTASELYGFYNLGVSKDLGSPVVGIAGLRLEGYLGVPARTSTAVAAPCSRCPASTSASGADYNGTDEVFDALFALDLPVQARRRLRPRHDPGDPLAAARATRPSPWASTSRSGAGTSARRGPERTTWPGQAQPERLESGPDSTVRTGPSLDELRERADWVARLTQPFAEPEGADPHKAMAPAIRPDSGRPHGVHRRPFPGGHTLPEEIRVYHETLDRAFTIAAGQRRRPGQAHQPRGRAILLDEVLIPYNHLLGQRKTNDSLIGMIAVAQTEFAAWVLTELDLPRRAGPRRVFYVFQTLCDIMEENRQDLQDRWEDSRFVWLPLQFALTPDQHDTQAELDAIIARAARQAFTDENQIWYVINEEFQWEMARSVREAEDYHVLWIHDFRGKNGQGEPDAIAYAHTLNYLEALIERVKAYDETGQDAPVLHLAGPALLRDQQGAALAAPAARPSGLRAVLCRRSRGVGGANLRETQDRLRQAVDESDALEGGRQPVRRQVAQEPDQGARQHHQPGRSSPSAAGTVAGIIPIPDNMMRDHRKIAFYDVTEADPYAALAMFTGMGIGEHYVGANWEDRAIMIQGPGALAVKDAARGLLVAQGIEPHEIPYPLRKLDKPANYQAMIDAEQTGAHARLVEATAAGSSSCTTRPASTTSRSTRPRRCSTP